MSDNLRKALEALENPAFTYEARIKHAKLILVEALASTPASPPDLGGRQTDDLLTMRNRIDKELGRRGVVTGKEGASSPTVTEEMVERGRQTLERCFGPVIRLLRANNFPTLATAIGDELDEAARLILTAAILTAALAPQEGGK